MLNAQAWSTLQRGSSHLLSKDPRKALPMRTHHASTWSSIVRKRRQNRTVLRPKRALKVAVLVLQDLQDWAAVRP